MKKMLPIIHFLLLSCFIPSSLHAWSDHPLLARHALFNLPVWDNIDSVEVKSLKQFLIETEESLALFLAEYESWAQLNIRHYLPRPDALAFNPGLDHTNLVERFFRSIRINPETRVALYLYLAPDQPAGNRTYAPFNELTTLERHDQEKDKVYVWIKPESLEHPLDVLVSANNEPDYGIDLGLFEDNATIHGKQYGFGRQPFGNPNLDYSSQAPFHMSFFHEAKILYRLAPSLKHTFLEMRVNQFRELAIFAFNHDQPYWGWRFLGWSMHYATDATMPYHSKPLPGYSTLRLLWINLKASLGLKKARRNAIQLVSNKHTIIEDYQAQEMQRAYNEQMMDHPFFMALQNSNDVRGYSESFIRDIVSKNATDDARLFDKTIKRYFPQHMVKDPSVEVIDLPELSNIAKIIYENGGEEARNALNAIIARRFTDYSMTIRTILFSVLDDTTGSSGHIAG